MSDDVSSRLRLIAPAASEPVTLSEAKLFLRIEHAAEDTAITRAIEAARGACEQYVGAALLPQTWQLAVCSWTRTRLALPFGPATAIASVTLTDSNGLETELGEQDFRLSVDGFSLFFDVVPMGAVTVEYEASMADHADTLPALLKQGILHHVAALMEQRGGTAPMPIASLQCYQPYRRIRL